MRRLLLAAALLAVGCGTSDPATSRISTGTECIVVDAVKFPGAEVGARFKVESDAAPEFVAEGQDYRRVRGVVLTGSEAGRVGTVHRAALRPL